MISGMYTVYDRAAEQAGPIFVAATDAVAARQYRHILDQVPAYDRDEYRLYKVGEWDDKACKVVAMEEAVQIYTASEVGKKNEESV